MTANLFWLGHHDVIYLVSLCAHTPRKKNKRAASLTEPHQKFLKTLQLPQKNNISTALQARETKKKIKVR